LGFEAGASFPLDRLGGRLWNGGPANTSTIIFKLVDKAPNALPARLVHAKVRVNFTQVCPHRQDVASQHPIWTFSSLLREQATYTDQLNGSKCLDPSVAIVMEGRRIFLHQIVEEREDEHKVRFCLHI
jgi:hypothetical protein